MVSRERWQVREGGEQRETGGNGEQEERLVRAGGEYGESVRRGDSE